MLKKEKNTKKHWLLARYFKENKNDTYKKWGGRGTLGGCDGHRTPNSLFADFEIFVTYTVAIFE